MSGQPTRAGLLPDDRSGGLAQRTVGEWRRFGAFLRSPSAPPRADIALGGTVAVLPKLFALDMLLMVAVLGAIGIATALGFELPEHMLGEMKLTPALIAFIVVGAPIAEEILFRGWLSGRLGHVLATILFAVAGAVLLTAGQMFSSGRDESGVLALAGAALMALAAGLLFVFRKRDAPAWYRRHFRWFFYASALLFAAIHLTNFAAAGASPALIALVLPQFMLGLILGYLRVNRGLMAGAALHMLHNAVFAGVMIAGAG